MHARLQLRLLGTFDASLDGAPLVGFRSAKARALLAYLAVETAVPHRRDALAALLWGEFPERDAQRSLSQVLTNLRSLLAPLSSASRSQDSGMETRPEFCPEAAPPLIEITGQSVRLREDPDCAWVDLHAFDALTAEAGLRGTPARESSAQAGLLSRAVDLYRGPFLAGMTLPGSPAFEEWRLLEQEQHHQAALLALERLAGYHLAEGRSEEVERYARRQLGLEPWNEAAHQSLMLALALGGRRGAALRQYEACRKVLAEELGVEPSAETEALHRQVRDGSWSELSPGARSAPGASTGLPPSGLVSRDGEMARLERQLELAFAGRGRVVLVTGEAGTGKTALLAHFARRAVRMPRRLVVAGGRCSAFAGLGDPFVPFRQILQALCCEARNDWAGERANPDHARRLWALFPTVAQALVENGPDLVGRFVPADGLESQAATLAPSCAPWLARLAILRQQAHDGLTAAGLPEAVFEQVTRVLQTVARRQPLLLLIDDLQWADSASLSLLFHLGRHLEGYRILVVGAYRPGECLPPALSRGESGKDLLAPAPSQGEKEAGPGLARIAREFARQWGDIRIDLDRAGGRRFVDALLDSEPNRLGEPFRERLTRHTGGHPLFTVEMLRAFQERGELVLDEEKRWVEGPAPHAQGLPARVEAVIGERMDRLPRPWRRVLEAACVEGETFSAEVAARAVGSKPAWVRELLSGPLSVEARLVQPLGVQRLGEAGAALSRYRFGHALFHEYLSNHLDAVQQAQLHAEVGTALESLCLGDEAALAEASPRLAHHYTQAGQPERAAHFLLLAGRRATRLTAYPEAVSLYRQALALVEQGPATRESARRQIEIFLALDTPLYAQRGWGESGRVEALEEAHRMALRLGEAEPLMQVLLLLADAHTWRGAYDASVRCAAELLRLAEAAQDLFYLPAGHLAAGLGHIEQGRLAAGRAHLEQALALGSTAGHVPPERRTVRPPLLPAAGTEVSAAALAWLSVALWLMGYGDQALSAGRRAMAEVEELADPLSQLLVVAVAGATFHALRGEAAEAQARAGRLMELSERHAFPYAGGWATCIQGWAQAALGEPDGLTCMRRGLPLVHQGKALAFRPALHCLMAEALLRAGETAEGLQVLDDVGPHGLHNFGAEVQRLRGELLLKAGPRPEPTDKRPWAQDLEPSSAEAEACFRHALEISRRQEARLLELRAAMSLARLWRAQGRPEEARDLLAGVYAWFTEGFDVRDLVQAREMLAE